MSRCRCCDAMLNQWESVRKNQRGEYLEVCSHCQPHITYYDREFETETLDFDTQFGVSHERHPED